jgi:hypothetical protein
MKPMPSRFLGPPGMRGGFFLILLASASPTGAIGAPDAAGAPSTSIRSEMLSEFKFEAVPASPKQPTAPAPEAPVSDHGLPVASQDPALVRMQPFEVRENTRLDALHSEIMTREENARTDAMVRRMGIGVHTAGGFYAVTVFFIPIQIGFTTKF